MSNNAYRIDALAPNKKAGETAYLMATSKTAAQRVYREQNPWMVDWTIEVTKIPKEEMPMAEELPVLVLPANDKGGDRDAYALLCLDLIRNALLEQKAQGVKYPRLLTQYPEDTVEEGNDSRDTVMLDRHDEVVVVDTGVR